MVKLLAPAIYRCICATSSRLLIFAAAAAFAASSISSPSSLSALPVVRVTQPGGIR